MFNSKKVDLVLEVYRGGIFLHVDLKKEPEVFYKNLPSNIAKDTSFKNVLKDAVLSLLDQFSKKHSVKVAKIFVFVHGDLYKVKSKEIFIKHDNGIKINDSLLKSVVKKEFDKEAFKNYTLEDYSISSKVAYNISPGFFNIPHQSRVAKDISLSLLQLQIKKDAKDAILEATSQYLQSDEHLHFLPASAIFLSFLPNVLDMRAVLLFDLSVETSRVFFTYNKHILSSFTFKNNYNSLIGKINQKLDYGFELSVSELELYLEGKCKSETCDIIKRELEVFKKELTREFEQINYKNMLVSSVFVLSNSVIPDVFAVWMKDFLAELFHSNAYFANNYASFKSKDNILGGSLSSLLLQNKDKLYLDDNIVIISQS